MATVSTLSKDEKRWRAESDAQTLAEAQRIAEDKGRLNLAKGAAQKMADDALKRARSLTNVAKTPVAKTPAQKKTAPKKTAPKKKGKAPRKR